MSTVKAFYRFRNDSGRDYRVELDHGTMILAPGADIDIPAGYALPTPGAGRQIRPSAVSTMWPHLTPVEELPFVMVDGRKEPVLYRTPAPQKGGRAAPTVTRIEASPKQMAAEQAQKEAEKIRAKAKAEAKGE